MKIDKGGQFHHVKTDHPSLAAFPNEDIKNLIPGQPARYRGGVVETRIENKGEIPPGRGEAILLVDDDLPILELARKILRGLGYTLLIAATPGEALAIAEARTGKIHLLATDVIMPEMNGRELADRLQSLYPGLKIMFMSGYTANAIAHHSVLDSGACFIQKPFSKRDLARTVRNALDSFCFSSL